MNLNQDGLVSLPVNTPGFQPAQPTTGGPPFNGGQQSNSGQQFNNGQSLNGAPPFTPQSPAPFQRPAAGGQPNTANPGNSNAALDAINNQLFRPNQAAGANGPVGSPGIAGVASKFEGPSIKAYRERTKFQEWEFVYEPGANQLGQAGAPAQNPQMNTNGQNQNGLGQNGAGQTPGQSPPGASQPNPFAQPNPFSQPNPFGPPSSPR
jgi:hypothetical protein